MNRNSDKQLCCIQSLTQSTLLKTSSRVCSYMEHVPKKARERWCNHPYFIDVSVSGNLYIANRKVAGGRSDVHRKSASKSLENLQLSLVRFNDQFIDPTLLNSI